MTQENSERPRAQAGSGWSLARIKTQAHELCMCTLAERFAQEERWGPQEAPMVRLESAGVLETGRTYDAWEGLFKYQNDRNGDDDRMDVVLLEEVFEALAAAVVYERGKANADLDSEQGRAELAQAKESVISELVQVAAVALKMAGIVERCD